MTNTVAAEAERASAVQPLPRPAPIYVIGDSHALIYNARAYANTERAFVFQSLFAPGIDGASCLDENGALSTQIIRAMVASRLLVEVDGRPIEAYHRTPDPAWRHAAVAEDRARVDPILVVSVGGFDAFRFLADVEADEIALPPSANGRVPAEIPQPVQSDAMAFDEAVRSYGERLKGLGGALRELRRMGFARIALLSVVPPTLHDDAFEGALKELGVTVSRHRLDVGFRYTCAIIANTALEQIARDANVVFVDRWDAQVRDGLALPGLLHDWIHLSSWAADATALDIIQRFYGGTVQPLASHHYQIYVEDPTCKDGIREYTVDERTFVLLRASADEGLVLFHDVHTNQQNWVNRSRVVRVAGPL